MALYRSVQLTFWTDNKVVDDFTPEDKYFYLYLFTNPHTTLCGCYEISIRQMAYELGYTVETTEKLIERFESYHKVIEYSKETKELFIKNWHKYNWQGGGQIVCIEKEIDNVKNENFKKQLTILFNQKFSKNKALEDNIGGAIGGLPSPIGASVYFTVTDTDTVINNKPEKIEKVKHKYGEYKNVLLTDEEMEKLRADYPDIEKRIDDLSNYIASKGAKYKSHYATIRNWARKETKITPKAEKWCNTNINNYDMDDYEKTILAN